jgi:hypothetical protein
MEARDTHVPYPADVSEDECAYSAPSSTVLPEDASQRRQHGRYPQVRAAKGDACVQGGADARRVTVGGAHDEVWPEHTEATIESLQ